MITAHALTAGNAPDGPTDIALLEAEDNVEVLADSAYGSGATLAALEDAGHTTTIKPWPTRPMTQHPEAFTIDDFAVDTTTATVTCPAGQTATITAKGNATFGARCRDCPMRARCTTAKAGKRMKVSAHHDWLARARTDAADPDWQDRYRQHRPMVERSIAWLVRRGHRRVRFRASTATASGSATAPRQSTCNACSPSGSPTTAPAGP